VTGVPTRCGPPRSPDDLPAECAKAGPHVLREGEVGAPLDRDPVVVVEADELAEPERSRETRRLARHALHEVAVRAENVGRVVDDLVSRAVVCGGERSFGHRGAHAVREPLTERTGRRLHSRRVAALGVTGRGAPPLTKRLQVLEAHLVARQVQERVEQHGRVAGGEDEPVTVGPGRIGGVVPEKAVPEDVRDGRGAHRRPRVSRVGLLDGIDGEKANRVDAELVESLPVAHGASLAVRVSRRFG